LWSTLFLSILLWTLVNCQLIPRGPKSLCKQHFDAHKKKELRIGKVEDQNPSAPYDMDQNTELAYLNSKQRRDTDKAPGNSKLAELAKLRPSKKFK